MIGVVVFVVDECQVLAAEFVPLVHELGDGGIKTGDVRFVVARVAVAWVFGH